MSKKDRWIRKLRKSQRDRGILPEYKKWWNELSDLEKVKERNLYEIRREKSLTMRSPYPMPDTSHLRLSQIPDKHIERIFVFKDRDLSDFV